MATRQDTAAAGRDEGLKDIALRAFSASGASTGRLASGLGTALLALLVLSGWPSPP